MKNVQVVDNAINCVYDIFAVEDADFDLLFPPGQDVAFVDEVLKRHPPQALKPVFERMWRHRVPKRDVVGLHGLLYYDMEHKKPFYPQRVDELAINPNGSKLRP
ncbi:hypothetical protein DX914_19420 [Lysobacter silvisoli]|uniref:Uncharacterized protein n=2 Tax=Lysobacter silvisoli TaxID=2293254 RepID=A0A371JWK7_9GAMM|nr:hypothetical protein DX914_19420 [Lysobacter silvisoli]